MASYFPQSGVNGFVIINGITLKADSFLWHENSNIIPAPAFGSVFVEHCVGQKSAVLSFSGTWNAIFNPFAIGIKAGAIVSAIYGLNNLDIATATTCFVQEWIIGDDVDDKADYSCTLVADWVFQDFSGATA